MKLSQKILILVFLTTLLLSSAHVQAISDLSLTYPTPLTGGTYTSNNYIINLTWLEPSSRSYAFVSSGTPAGDLVAWYTMDSNSVTTMVDSSGKGNHATLLTGVTNYTSFAWGNASLSVDRFGGARVTNNNINSLLTEDTGFTLSSWIYIKNDFISTDLFTNAFTTGGFTWRLSNTSSVSNEGSYIFRLVIVNSTYANPEIASSRVSLPTNEWHHVAISYYKTKVCFYLDGQSIDCETFIPGLVINPSNLGQTYFFTSNFDVFMNIDDIAVFARPLLPHEVSQLYETKGFLNYSAQRTLFNLPSNQLLVNRGYVLNEAGSIALTNSTSFTMTESGPNFIQASASFEPIINRAYMSAQITRGFSEVDPKGNYSDYIGAAYYRANDGPWMLISNNTYLPWGAEKYSGNFGDSLTSFGRSYSWAMFIDGFLNSHFFPLNLLLGVGGAECNAVATGINTYASANSFITLQCGTNDIGHHVPLETIYSRYETIFSIARQKNLSIYLMNVPPRQETEFIENISALNTWLYNYYIYNNSDRLIRGLGDVYNSNLTLSNKLPDPILIQDGIHPRDAGAVVYADAAWTTGFHSKYYGGFYTEFVPPTPSVNSTYDLKWVMTSPNGLSSEYLFSDVFNLTGSGITQACIADLDDGSNTGTSDGGVDVNDLTYFLNRFEMGSRDVDLDDGSNTGTSDGGVDVNDLLYFLLHFEEGC